MIQAFKTGMALMALCAFTGCTTLQALEDPTPARIQQSIERGDDVKVVATNGTTYYLNVTRVEADSFTGATSQGKRFKVPYKAVESMDVSQFSALGTVGAGAVAIAVVGTIAVIVALHSLDFHFGLSFCE